MWEPYRSPRVSFSRLPSLPACPCCNLSIDGHLYINILLQGTRLPVQVIGPGRDLIGQYQKVTLIIGQGRQIDQGRHSIDADKPVSLIIYAVPRQVFNPSYLQVVTGIRQGLIGRQGQVGGKGNGSYSTLLG